jgi:hypothetical protein
MGWESPVGCGEPGLKYVFTVSALDALAIVFRADPQSRALAVRAGNLDVTGSLLWDALSRETVRLAGIRSDGLGRALVPQRLRLCLESRGWPGGSLILRAGRRVPVGCGQSRAKNMVTEFALHAPIQVFGPDPHIRAPAIRAGNMEVTRHDLLQSPIREPVNRGGIGLSRYERRQFRARQKAFPPVHRFWIAAADDPQPDPSLLFDHIMARGQQPGRQCLRHQTGFGLLPFGVPSTPRPDRRFYSMGN